MDFSSFKETFSFIQLFLIALFLFWLIFPYLRAEVLSLIYLPNVNSEVVGFCKNKNQDNPLKYTKMLSKDNRRVRVLCVHQDNSENLIVELGKSKEGNWSINFSTTIDKPGVLYWPYYF